MPDETHKLQKQPAEGSRKLVERELERQDEKPGHQDAKKQERPDDKRDDLRR